ncbi:MAG TPA: class I SAM-dependent methyltransferase [Fimbriimonas sp.]|nr:class I SAM-dependent methyltransferase [Fimbriimonas sp.]
MPAEYQVVPCLVCGSRDFDTLLTPEQMQEEADWLQSFHMERSLDRDADLKDRAEFTQAESVFLLRCKRCRTLLRNPQPTPEALRELYRNDHYGKSTLEELFEAEREFFREKADLVDLPSGAGVLEVGSFVGAFLLAARETGWHATGLDIGRETSAFMRGLGLEVLEGTVLDLSPHVRFDAIFIWNTFDQINEPRAILRKIKALVKPAGLLIIRVPNGEFKSAALECASGRMRKLEAFNNFLTFPYLCGYTPGSLTSLLRQEGFEICSLTGDVVSPLPKSRIKPSAVEEEARAKRLNLRLCRRDGPLLCPWINVVSRAIS